MFLQRREKGIPFLLADCARLSCADASLPTGLPAPLGQQNDGFIDGIVERAILGMASYHLDIQPKIDDDRQFRASFFNILTAGAKSHRCSAGLLPLSGMSDTNPAPRSIKYNGDTFTVPAWPRRARLPVPHGSVQSQRMWLQIVAMSEKHPRYGYRRITAMLRREGLELNAKRVAAGKAAGSASGEQEAAADETAWVVDYAAAAGEQGQ
jgi:hypothetical protein